MIIPSSSRIACVALAAMIAALPAVAQETATQTPEADAATTETAAPDATASETEAPAPAATEEAATGEAADALGQPYVADVADDWQIECLRTTLEADPCRMVQLLLDQGNPAVRVEIVALPQGGPAPAVATFYSPLQTLLSEQLTLSVDGGRKSKHMFNYCTPQFCVAQVPFAPDAVAAFKRGNAAEAVIVPLQAPDQEVVLKMSLKGFTAGFDKIVELTAASAAAIQKANSAQGGN
ncbi:invasion associated locus B family protein [Tropicimonas sp. TH_r6]|uniref:invasion associated locus B family protein n=1 Tax=Tropicimonas sp. TH_r6 TaxID=3082085 RepID=UPI0029543C50|nr:invasion associated locus B family protein [Tropicimonas sp. TH_r6]MDV7141574.1 invasion associated locus B family protein [Tropicimonas sp. TH_r6]